MDQHPHQTMAGSDDQEPRDRLFEGSVQETVEILPHIERMSPRAREQGVIAGIGRDRVDRHVVEGRVEASVATRLPPDARSDEMTVATYQVFGYFTLAVATLLLVLAIAVVITKNIGY